VIHSELLECNDMSDFKNYKYLIVRESNFKLEIILNRPDKKNAINSEMLEELMSCTDYANENDSVRAVVYKSTGDVFCAGLDLYDFKENNMTNALSDVFNLLHKPKLAVLEGDAYGGGVLLILCCNYVISKSDVKLCLPEVDRGLFPFQVMDALIKVMPAKKALDWCIRGLSVDAKDCLKMNVIDEINNNIEESVSDWISTITSKSPNAIASGLKSFENIYVNKKIIGKLNNELQKLKESDDFIEGIESLREKREPRWKKL